MKNIDNLECCIVIVDDDDTVLDVFKKSLSEKMKSATIKGFNSINDEFFDYIKNHHIDLFVIDIILGNDKSGIDLSNELLKIMKGLIFLFVSGFDYTIDSFNQFKGKCIYDFISKPINVEEFIVRCSCLVRTSKSFNLILNNNDLCYYDEKSIELLRDEYFKQLEEDRKMIKKFNEKM